jgi:hypothetical protein
VRPYSGFGFEVGLPLVDFFFFFAEADEDFLWRLDEEPDDTDAEGALCFCE